MTTRAAFAAGFATAVILITVAVETAIQAPSLVNRFASDTPKSVPNPHGTGLRVAGSNPPRSHLLSSRRRRQHAADPAAL